MNKLLEAKSTETITELCWCEHTEESHHYEHNPITKVGDVFMCVSCPGTPSLVAKALHSYGPDEEETK